MNYAALVMQVFYATKQLVEVIAAELFVKAALSVLNFDVGEQVALLDKLENDEVDLDGLAVVFGNDFAVAVILHQPDDVGMVHFLEESDLVEQNLLEQLKADLLHVVSFYDLDCIKLVGVVFARS